MIPNDHKNFFVLFKKSKETSFLLVLMDIYEIFTSRLVQSKRTDLKEFYDSCFDFLKTLFVSYSSITYPWSNFKAGFDNAWRNQL